jgi:hypothetical protein
MMGNVVEDIYCIEDGGVERRSDVVVSSSARPMILNNIE